MHKTIALVLIFVGFLWLLLGLHTLPNGLLIGALFILFSLLFISVGVRILKAVKRGEDIKSRDLLLSLGPVVFLVFCLIFLIALAIASV